MELQGCGKIQVFGETHVSSICCITLENEYHLSGEEVILRACSALLPEIDFNPKQLFLKDKSGYLIEQHQRVYAGECVTLHSTKGDFSESRERSGVLFKDGHVEVVPYSMHHLNNIRHYILCMHQKEVKLEKYGMHLFRVVSEKASRFEVWCFIEDDIKYGTSVLVSNDQVSALHVMRTALAQMKLSVESYELVGTDHIVVPQEQIRIKRLIS